MDEDEFVVEGEEKANRKAQERSEDDLEGEGVRAEDKVAKLRKDLEATRKEKQENMDGWQRSKADYVNLLRRFETELKEAKGKGVEKAVEAFLPALDAITRAKAAGEVPEGFKGIAGLLESGFKSLAIQSVGAIGERFDATIHEAYGQDATDDRSKDDTVTEVLEPGYKLGDRVIRPAKVKVAHFG